MPKLSPDDIAFFRAKMRGVKPIKSVTPKKKSATRVKVQKTTPKPYVPRPIRAKPEISIEEKEFPFSDSISETVYSESKLFYLSTGLQYKTLHALKAGEIKQTAILDLHGATVDEARSLLTHFLNRCLSRGERCIRIIHGKGKANLSHPPTIKNHLNSWLRQHPAVLAFCSAIPRDGGAGAVYVMLRKSQSKGNGRKN